VAGRVFAMGMVASRSTDDALTTPRRSPACPPRQTAGLWQGRRSARMYQTLTGSRVRARQLESRSPLYSETTASRSVDDASSKSTFSPTAAGVATPLKREKANPVA